MEASSVTAQHMEIQFLGTSSGVPTRSRNMTAIAIRTRGARHWSLVDCAEGTQHRLLRTNLSPTSLRAIFITHLHGDHCYGLPGLLARVNHQHRNGRLGRLFLSRTGCQRSHPHHTAHPAHDLHRSTS